jgi:glutathionylspermidine synthase
LTTSQAEQSSSLYDEEDEPMTPKIRSLQDIYEATNELYLLCLLADAEDIIFEQTMKDEK